MALTSISLLKIKSIKTPFPSSSYSVRPTNPPSIVCQLHTSTQTNQNDPKRWKTMFSTALAAAVITFSFDMSALADLNKYETETRGEFGVSSVSEDGSENLRRTEFDSAAEYKASLLTEGRDNHHQETTDTSSLTYNYNQDDGGSDQEEFKAMAAMAQFVRWAMEDSLQEFVNFVTEYFVRRGHYSISRLYY